MKLTCMFSFILLFGAAGLLVFIHLQDPEEIIHQQTPGMRYNMESQQPKKDCSSSHYEEGKRQGNADDEFSMAHQRPSLHPMQHGLRKHRRTDHKPDTLAVMKDPHKKVGGPHFARTHKRRRRFVLKKSPILMAVNDSYLHAAKLKSEEADDVQWRHLYQTQRERKRIMKDTCLKYKSNSKRIITPYHVSRLFVEDKYRILYCEVPKAGCSNWKRVLMVLNGLAASTNIIQHNTVHYGNYLKRLDGFDRKGINHRLSTYTKMLFVREPFEKLVSAFRDKFEHPNNYYHPVFGRPIISKYRVNATKEALRTGSGVTFKEFIQYLLDVHRPVGMDIHWDHVNRLCSPCLIDYDFIGKFETMEEDANFFLHLINAPQNLTFPRFKDRHSDEERTTTQITKQYFKQLSPSQRQRSYDFYYMDYLMFNYSKPFEDLY
ncbi:carbohydrate sulfotransferase 8 [Sceloporus undulatus]|uniref:carbohydrate sulfotransferase 8 n=1 Tax=Sceloporus undulatus TaxID=8520 RepID=UPI001C4D8E2B|nr:carbohydrate sulfotransferase 8 [Sceloporus undulatus]XP_042294576.1 carbohydrate sulfotransferase 8 [Sceloporus undulatus]XP_042294577.1 carbohydrate sulfotransferase 8 [Sceloporus undulatus]